MSIIARSVTLNPGSALLGRTINVTTTTGPISVLLAGTARARIDVAEFLVPGTIVLDAVGAIEIQGIVTAQGTGADGGNGTIALMAGGDVKTSIDVSGAGGVNAPDLKTKTATVNISGLGSVTIWVTDQLTGDISGGGSVSYYGDPQTNTTSTGLGQFKSLGEK